MRLKKLSVVLVALLFTVFLLGTAMASLRDIEITKEEISPQPVYPGNDFTVSISVYNKGDTAEDITVELIEEFPFVLKYSSQDLKEEFSLCSGCKRQNTYYMTADRKAISGLYKLKFFVSQDGTGVKEELNVEIKGKPDIIFEVLESSQDITPNSEFKVRLNLKNKGTGVAKNIKLTSVSKDFAAAGTNLMFIEELEPNESRELNLVFYTANSLSKDVHALPLVIEYEDYKGNQYRSSQDISVRVVNKAKLSIKEVKVEPSRLKPGDEITIQVRIENIGEGDADNVKLVLESEIEGNKNAYLGRLEKDDDSPAFFSGRVKTAGEKADKLIISYEDDLGKHYLEEEIKYDVRGVGTSFLVIVALVVVILFLAGLLGAVWLYQRCKCYLKGKKCEHKSHLPAGQLFSKKKSR